MKSVIVVGGGISGLTCAWHLAQTGYKVSVFEREENLGGLAASFVRNDYWLPLTYHHVMLPDKYTQQYLERFGLDKELRWVKSSQMFLYEGQRYLLSRPQHIFAFSPLNFKDQLRLLYLGIHIWLKKDWESLAGVDCQTWLNKMIGTKATDLLFKNLMDIKFSMPLSSVSAAWLGSRMHQSVRNRDFYGYPRSGWQQLFNIMQEDLVKKGATVVNKFEVTKISRGQISGVDKNGQVLCHRADIIVSSVPAKVLVNIMQVPERYRSTLSSIKYKPFISFVCGSSCRISAYYWSVVLKPRLVFGGFFNHTVLDPFYKDNEDIYYFFTYLEEDDDMFKYSEQELKETYLADIHKLFPNFEMNWFKIFKLRFSQPIFSKDYSNPPIELSDDLFITGIYRQFPRPRTMDSAFNSGAETADYIIKKYGR